MSAPVVIPFTDMATPEQLRRIIDADPVFDVYSYIRQEFGKVAGAYLTEEQAAQVVAWIELRENDAFDCADWQVNR